MDGTFSGNEYLLVAAPTGQIMTTHASQAAHLSGHWPAQQAASDLGGSVEMKAATISAGGVPVDSADGIFELGAPHIRN